MKKFLALLLAATLVLAAVPALAFTGHETDPGLPAVSEFDENILSVEIERMENEPAVETTPWGETTYLWEGIDADTPIAVGDTVTLSFSYEVPDAEFFEGFTEEELASIELRFCFDGLENVTIFDQYGLNPNYECDYDAGYCYPLDGFGNAELFENELVIYADLGRAVYVIIQGVATAETVTADYQFTIGQYSVPAHFSVGKLTTCEGGWYIYDKDIMNVQIRGMKFFAEDGVFSGYYVCLNDHDYLRNEDGTAFTSVEDPEVVETEGTRFDALTRAYNTFMDFFGFTDDDIEDVLTDGVFLDGCEAVRYIGEEYEFGGGEPTPIDVTDEPGDEPVATEIPVQPTPPATGAVSLVVIGVAAIVSGAGVVIFRRKN